MPAAIANNANLDILVLTGSKPLDVFFSFQVGGDFEFFLYENVTVSANGTAVGIRNHNLFNAGAPPLSGFNGPTVTGLGIQIMNVFIPGGSGGNSIGGEVVKDTGFIFLTQTLYLFRMTNRSGGAQDAGMVIDFTEFYN